MAEINETGVNSVEELNDILRVRREKLAALYESGNNPFEKTKFDFDTYTSDIVARFEELENTDVKIAGRMMSRRDMGKANFIDIQDGKGRIQCYIKIDDVGAETFEQYKKWDIGDIVGVSGTVFRTRRGEISVHVKAIELLSKSLLPLPEKFHGLKDTDTRFRQRYVDLIVNPEVKRNFIIRSQFIKFMRKYLDDMDYIEVETPVLNTIAGGASARPFITHHNTLDLNMYMRIATELPLKRQRRRQRQACSRISPYRDKR